MDDFEPTETVAIELDDELDEDGYSDDYDQPTTSEVQLSSPPAASTLVPHIPSTVKVKHLRSDAKRLLQLRLDPLALGSMRNWEYVANQLGLDNDRIINLQRRDSPTEHLLNLFADYSLAHFMASIVDSNRIDLLISLQPHINGIQPQKESAPRIEDSVFALRSQSSVSVSSIPEDQFVVVTHCSPKKSEERKLYKWFLKNFKEAGRTNETKIIDIDDFLSSDDELSDLELLFRKAWQIVVVCSLPYKQLMESDGKSYGHSDKLKRYFHKKLIDAEYMELGRNERFRTVTLLGASSDVLLNGWQKNTLVHEFPTQYSDFLQRIFKE